MVITFGAPSPIKHYVIMIRVIKKTPATINGRDCLELLVQDDFMLGYSACDLCCYRDYVPDKEIMADCATVHGCTINNDYYFLAMQEDYCDKLKLY